MRLTPRGIGLLAAGGVLALTAASTSALGLAQLAALLLGLVVVALLWVLGSRRRSRTMRLHRRVEPSRPVVAQSATVHLQVAAGSLGTWTRLRERASPLLQRTQVQPSRADRRGWTYRIRPRARGHHLLGPATVVHADPLGLLRWARPGDDGTPILVWPLTVPVDLEQVRLLSGSEHAPIGPPQRSVQDLTLREYVRGDDIHRVHWRSSARRGQLMVRADEPSRPSAVDLLVDLGRGAGAEWAVSACASLAIGLVAEGLPVRLHVCRRTTIDAAPTIEVLTCTQRAEVLDALAPATPTAPALRSEQRYGLSQAGPGLIAVLHSRDQGLLQALAPLATNRRAYALFVTDRHDDRVQAAAMAAHGWALHVVAARADTSGIAACWSRLLDPQVVR